MVTEFVEAEEVAPICEKQGEEVVQGRTKHRGEPCENIVVEGVGIKKRCGRYCKKHPGVEKTAWSKNSRPPRYGNFMCPACNRERGWKRLGIAGLTWSTFQSLPTVCTICGSTDRLVPDHDHTTGEVRGILCDSCNHGLGNFADNVERLRAAVRYLGGDPCSVA